MCKSLRLKQYSTVLSAKSDSELMFCLESNQGLKIDISLVYLSYPQDRSNTQVIYRFAFQKCSSSEEYKLMFYLAIVYIEDIYFFEVNTKHISSSVLKTSEFSWVRSTN